MLFGNNFLGGARWGAAPPLGTFTGQYTLPVEVPEKWVRRTTPIDIPEETVTVQVSGAKRAQRARRRR